MALAIVVEARSISSKWVQGERRFFKSIQGALWAIPLLLYAIAIPKCFDAQAGKPVSEGWTSLISFTVSLGVSALLINPALELLVRSNARIVAYILRFLVSSSSEFQIAWLRLLNRRQRQKIRKNVERLERAEIEFSPPGTS
ncbi:hypothetical protein [Micromonospora zamorensis]|uniref:hypothetical protein n=1 Tax=Micromonospora zamorensis TaxID=709883 RepID=UPI0033AF8E01